MIHERVCCNRRSAATTSLRPTDSPSGPCRVLPLLAKLKDPKTDWSVLAEVAWALGKIPDTRSIQPLHDLDKKLQSMCDPENVPLKKFNEAVFRVTKQRDTWDQFS